MNPLELPNETYALDGQGHAAVLEWSLPPQRSETAKVHWHHLSAVDEDAAAWLGDESTVAPHIRDALLATETRPRLLRDGDGLLLIFRGVNLNPGADPEDMISLRLWAQESQLITVRRRRLLAVQELRDALHAGNGPSETGELIAFLASRLVARMEPVLEHIDEALESMEESIAQAEVLPSEPLSALRVQVIRLRRYLAPQREVLTKLALESVSWLTEDTRIALRETADRLTRFVEQLDSARERAVVLQDEVRNQQAERMNRTIYLLSLVAAIMLPLGFVTGLLGINVGGMPGVDSPFAFAVVTLALLALAGFELVLLRRLKWL